MKTPKPIYSYPCDSRHISESAWFYELNDGITVVQQLWQGNKLIDTVMVTIPWNKISSAVDRHRKIKRYRMIRKMGKK